MAAIVQIQEITGSNSGVDKTSGTVRFKSADNTTVDLANGLTIPNSGTIYSYTKQLRFNFQTAPATNIQNLRAYSSGGGFGTGVGLNYDTTNAFGSNFQQQLSTGTNFFLRTISSPIALDTTNTGPFTGTGYKGDILRFQMSVTSTAVSGLLTAQTATFTYDES